MHSSDPRYILNPDALLHASGSCWILSNPRTKTHVEVDALCIQALTQLEPAARAGWVARLSEASATDRTRIFYGEDGLHTDHTGIVKSTTQPVTGEALFALLCARWLLIAEDRAAYQAFLQPLTSVLDRSHLGTLHQRVGQYLTIGKRMGAERWQWWHNQKYTADGLALHPGPYKSIQEQFINDYFKGRKLTDLQVLDFGCGNGYYSAKLASFGAKVTGIDTSKELIELAAKNHGDKAKFIWIDPAHDPKQLLTTLQQKFEMIFMQDVLLLLLNPENGSPLPQLADLLATLRKLLTPQGKLHTMEPNAIFWLAGRYGDPQHPYAVVTEYANPVFNVVPRLGQILQQMEQAGFALVEYQHPKWPFSAPTESAQANYANQYAIWDFMTFVPIAQ